MYKKDKKDAVSAVIITAFALALIGCVYCIYRLSANKEEAQKPINDVRLQEDVEQAPANEQLASYIAANEDTKAIIKIEDTMVDYPVMQGEEEEYYLHRGIDKVYDFQGLPFLQQGCDVNRETNLIIYGHRMLNGTQFGTLGKYAKQGYYEEHPEIILLTEKGEQKYSIFAAGPIPIKDRDGFTYNEYVTFESEGQFNYFMTKIKEINVLDAAEFPSYGTNIMILSTCYQSGDSDYRFVVLAKPVGR